MINNLTYLYIIELYFFQSFSLLSSLSWIGKKCWFNRLQFYTWHLHFIFYIHFISFHFIKIIDTSFIEIHSYIFIYTDKLELLLYIHKHKHIHIQYIYLACIHKKYIKRKHNLHLLSLFLYYFILDNFSLFFFITYIISIRISLK